MTTEEAQSNQPRFVANPHALIRDGKCTDVVFMQDYDDEEIANTLSKYQYDEVVRWEDYGSEIYVGFHKYGNRYAYHRPYPSWVLNKYNQWEAPIPLPSDAKDIYYSWHEDTLSWVRCDLCILHEKEYGE